MIKVEDEDIRVTMLNYFKSYYKKPDGEEVEENELEPKMSSAPDF